MAWRWLFGYPKDSEMQQLCAQITDGPNEGAVKSFLKLANEEGSGMDMCPIAFQMPLHYPRYTKADYEKMEEWKVDKLLRDYGLNFKGTLDEKRAFAMGAFLWPHQY